MKKLLLSFVAILLSTMITQSQCTFSGVAFGSGTAPGIGASLNVTTCAYAGEYQTLTGVSAGNSFTVTITGGASNFVTIYNSSFTPIFWGASPVSFTAPSAGTYYSQVNLTGCGTDFSCHSVLWANTTPPPPCPAVTTPWTDNVETHLATTSLSISNCWSASAITSFNWNVTGTGTTPSFGTGANAANSGMKYFYTEASGATIGAEAILVTPDIILTGLTLPTLKFYYHMFGGQIGTLFVEISNNGGLTWNPVTSLVGAQQLTQAQGFSLSETNLIGYTGTVKIRFRAVSAGSFEGDICIDDISVVEGPFLNSASLTFPNVCVGSNNVQSTTITGGGLTGSSVVVGPFASYGFSTNPLGPFDPTVTLSYVGSTLSSVIYVQYLPLAAGNNNGNIPMLGGGAIGTVATTAEAFAIPSVSASSTPSPATVCAGSSVTLNGGGATTYTWSDGVNTPIDGVSFVPASSSTYTVTGTTAGCSSTATLAVTVNPIPTVTASATPNDTVCFGNPITLQGGGASTYTWNANATLTSDTTITPAIAGTYTVVGTDANGCSASSTIAITTTSNPYNLVIPNPELLYYKFDGVGTSVPNQALTPPLGTATATILGGITQGSTGQSGGALVGSGVASSTDYLNTGYAPNLGGGSWTISFWSAGFGSTAALYYIFGDVNTNSFRCFTNGVAGAGNWILRATGLTDITIPGGAQSTPTLNTYVYDATLNNVKGYLNGVLVSTVAQTAPNLTGVGPLKVMGYSSNIGAPLDGKLDEFRLYNRALNAAEVLQLMATASVVTATVTPTTICAGATATLTGTGATTYSWNPGIITGSPVNVNPTSTTIYTVTGADANGCTGTTSVTLNVNPLPTVTATPTTQTVCENGQATVTGGGAGVGGTYAWSGLILDATPFTVNSSAIYTVTGTDGNNCSNTATAVVTMNAAPLVTASATPTTTCDNSIVVTTGGGATSYVWNGGLFDGVPFVASIGTTSYTVTGTDGAGCTATSSVTVTGTAASGTLAPSTSNQVQNQGDDLNASYYDLSCNLIASIDDGNGGNILGLTTATVNVDANAGVYNGQPFVRRWYQITPSNNVGVSAMVTLYIDQADFTNYNSVVTAPYLPMPTSGNNADPNINNIRITKNADAGLGNSPLVITPTTVNWNGTYWELTFPVTGFSQFRVHSVNPGNVALPATITNFSGRKLNYSDMLEWTTASEQNNAYFNLQHGTDGVNFTTIAKVNSKAANGNSSSILNYNFENTKPQLGHNYYRLQQVDIDNHSTMNAKVVDIIWGTNGSTVSIYPNPTQDVLNIDLFTTKVQNTKVKVLDMSGRIVKQVQARSEAGINKLSLSLGDIASGVYTVQVFENDQLTHVSKVKKND